VITTAKVQEQMIWVKVQMENGSPVFKVEDQVVAGDELESKLRSFVKSTSKTQLLFEHDYDAPQSAVVTVLDAAKGAGMEKVSLRLPDQGK
jgi:biopolymer transport protein ExbD